MTIDDLADHLGNPDSWVASSATQRELSRKSPYERPSTGSVSVHWWRNPLHQVRSME
jgi:hypothetical protein